MQGVRPPLACGHPLAQGYRAKGPAVRAGAAAAMASAGGFVAPRGKGGVPLQPSSKAPAAKPAAGAAVAKSPAKAPPKAVVAKAPVTKAAAPPAPKPAVAKPAAAKTPAPRAVAAKPATAAAPAKPAAPKPAAPRPAAPAAATKPAAPKPAVSVPKPVAPKPATPKPVAPKPAAPKPAAPKPAAPAAKQAAAPEKRPAPKADVSFEKGYVFTGSASEELRLFGAPERELAQMKKHIWDGALSFQQPDAQADWELSPVPSWPSASSGARRTRRTLPSCAR
ncbi:unnamed protein product, partial [Prorocentrum cordatum]